MYFFFEGGGHFGTISLILYQYLGPRLLVPNPFSTKRNTQSQNTHGSQVSQNVFASNNEKMKEILRKPRMKVGICFEEPKHEQ